MMIKNHSQLRTLAVYLYDFISLKLVQFLYTKTGIIIKNRL